MSKDFEIPFEYCMMFVFDNKQTARLYYKKYGGLFSNDLDIEAKRTNAELLPSGRYRIFYFTTSAVGLGRFQVGRTDVPEVGLSVIVSRLSK